MISPTLLQVDLTAYCNDSCVFCSYRKPDGYNNKMLKLIEAVPGREYDEYSPIGKPTKEGSLPDEFATKLPIMMKEAGIPAIELTGGGEPTLWRNFDLLVKNLMDAGIEIGLVTNGSTLPKERIELLANACTWIRFSMDASEANLHKEIHHTANFDFERRIENLERLIKKRRNILHSKLVIGISFIITPKNHHDIERAIQLYKAMGVQNIRFSWMYDRTGTAGLDYETIELLKRDLEILKEKYQMGTSFNVYFESGRIETYSQINDDFSKCYMQRFVWAVGADSKVYPCCIVKYWPKMELADLREKSLKEIIENQTVKEKMDKLNPKGCPPCWLRTRNKIMASAIEKPLHENFV